MALGIIKIDKVLVIGGAGFIGSHTVDALLMKKYYVRVLDNLQEPVHQGNEPKYLDRRAEFVLGDVCDKEKLSECLLGIDYVFHFAAYQDYLPDFSTFFHVNAVGTALLYEIIVANKLPVKKVIIASSQAVMGEGRYNCSTHRDFFPVIRSDERLAHGAWEIQCSECGRVSQYVRSDEGVVSPQNQYAMSKYSQEMLALNLGKRYDIPTVCMRYSIVQGPRQSFFNTYSGVMRIFTLALFHGKRPIIYEDGEQVRDFVNIYDVVDANMLVLEKEETDYQVFNVGGGKAITVNKFYEEVDSIYQTCIEPIRESYYRYGDTRHIISDISKLQTLGWKPKRNIRDSILSYKEFLEGQNSVPDVLTKSIEEMKARSVIRQATIES